MQGLLKDIADNNGYCGEFEYQREAAVVSFMAVIPCLAHSTVCELGNSLCTGSPCLPPGVQAVLICSYSKIKWGLLRGLMYGTYSDNSLTRRHM